MSDRPTYEELQQDQSRRWADLQRQREWRFEQMRVMAQQPWRCASCGASGLTDPICPRCRSARIFEVD